jgi:hypothetical protein
MSCNTYAPSQSERSGRQAHRTRNAAGSPELEARRREIMLLLEEIRAPQPMPAETLSCDDTR